MPHVRPMPRRTAPEPPKPPSVSKADGRRRLTMLIGRGEALLSQRPLKEGQAEVWSTSCIETIEATFGGGSSHLYTFVGQIRVIPYSPYGSDTSYDRHDEERDVESIQRRIGVLKTLVE